MTRSRSSKNSGEKRDGDLAKLLDLTSKDFLLRIKRSPEDGRIAVVKV